MINPRLEHPVSSLDSRVVVGSLAEEATLQVVDEEDSHEAVSVEEEAGAEVEVDVDVGAEGHQKEGATVT